MITSLLQYLHSGSMGPLTTHLSIHPPHHRHHPMCLLSLCAYSPYVPTLHPLSPSNHHPHAPTDMLLPPIHPCTHPPMQSLTHLIDWETLGGRWCLLHWLRDCHSFRYCHRACWTQFMVVPLQLHVTTSTSLPLRWHWIVMRSRQTHVHHSM